MSDGPPWIVCRASFTDDAIRDALREGIVAASTGEWIIEPEAPEWPRAVDLLVDVNEGPEHILLVGPGSSVTVADGSASVATSEEDPFGEDEIEIWRVPTVEVVRAMDRDPLHRWPRDRAEIVDAAEVAEASLWSQIEELLPELVQRTEAWLADTPDRVARQIAHLERLEDTLMPAVGMKTKLALARASHRTRVALNRLIEEALVASGIGPPSVTGVGAAPRRVRAGGVEVLAELDAAVNGALAELLDAVAAARLDAQARTRTAASLEEAVSWVQEHGSERLRKAQELGALDLAMGAYRDERLGHLGPLWFWLPEQDSTALRNPVNPSENALDLLAGAREEVDPKARLRFHTKAKVTIVVASLLDRKIWRPAMDWVDGGDIESVIRMRGRTLGPSEFISASMDEEPF